MIPTKAATIAQLQKEILSLQGLKSIPEGNSVDMGLGAINDAFPFASFPLGAVHEFICAGEEDAAATAGFTAGLLSTLMLNGGTSVWIASARTIFPPALQAFGIVPDKVIFIDLQKEKEMLWVIEEALKCEGLSAVIGEIKELSFTASRRLQLAVEKSNVTGFIIRRNPRNVNATACVTRWKITNLPSGLTGDMPGVGFPRWNVELLKVRNGKPGTWPIEFIDGRFRHVYKMAAIMKKFQKKAG